MSYGHSAPAEVSVPNVPAGLPLLLTIEQVARETGTGLTHTRKMIAAGRIPSVRISPRIIRVPRDALLAVIAAGGVQVW